MTREFQVLYRETARLIPYEGGSRAPVVCVDSGHGPVLTVMVMAEAEDQIRAQFEAAGCQVVGVNLVRAVVDWSKPNFNRDEAAEYLSIKADSFTSLKGNGKVPWAHFVRGLVPRVLLDRMIRNALNPVGKQLAKELEQQRAA